MRLDPFRFHVAAALTAALALAAPAPALAGAYEDLLGQLKAQGAGPFDAARGQALWIQDHPDPGGGPARSCATCHTDNLKASGKHVKTGKVIDPLAPSANPDRLTDAAKMEKWLKRNCSWTLGRECTPQEKGDVLTYIHGQ